MILLVSCTILARAVNLTKMNELRFYNRTVVAQPSWGRFEQQPSDAWRKCTCSPQFINVRDPLDPEDFYLFVS